MYHWKKEYIILYIFVAIGFGIYGQAHSDELKYVDSSGFTGGGSFQIWGTAFIWPKVVIGYVGHKLGGGNLPLSNPEIWFY